MTPEQVMTTIFILIVLFSCAAVSLIFAELKTRVRIEELHQRLREKGIDPDSL